MSNLPFHYEGRALPRHSSPITSPPPAPPQVPVLLPQHPIPNPAPRTKRKSTELDSEFIDQDNNTSSSDKNEGEDVRVSRYEVADLGGHIIPEPAKATPIHLQPQPRPPQSHPQPPPMAANNTGFKPQHIANNQWRYVRACMVCAYMMPRQRFHAHGCPNCPFLDLKGSPEAIESCTSGSYEGTMSIMQPGRSWIARWFRIDNLALGTYAMKVDGTLPEDVKQMLEEMDIIWFPRDGSSFKLD